MRERTRAENLGRGALFALIVVPLGAIAFSTFWNALFVAPLVFLVVAWLAVALYRLGARGPMSWRGVLIVTGVVIPTLVASIVAGLIAEVAIGVGGIARVAPVEAMGVPQFWTVFADVLADPAAQSRFVPSILVAIAFAAIGIFSATRAVFHRQTIRAASA